MLLLSISVNYWSIYSSNMALSACESKLGQVFQGFDHILGGCTLSSVSVSDPGTPCYAMCRANTLFYSWPLNVEPTYNLKATFSTKESMLRWLYFREKVVVAL